MVLELMKDHLNFNTNQKTDLQKKLTSQVYNFAKDTKNLTFK